MTVLGGVVTYNPDVSRLGECLGALAPQVDAVLVVDNGSENLNEIDGLLSTIGHAALIPLGENRGIAAALNRILQHGCDNGYSHVLTMDQDSILGENAVKKMLPLAEGGAALVSPWVLYEGNEGFQRPRPVSEVDDIDWAITSGSLTSVEAWGIVGGFDEAMFIDGVDKDFCFRLRKVGYEILRCNRVLLHHELGDLKCRKVLGRTVYITNHSPMRKYYMVRNGIYLARKGVVSRSSALSGVTKEFLKSFFYESGKAKKFFSMCSGVRDAFSMEVENPC